ncbi:hypothetical protein M422DRAFT_24068 [Sphaerobolus stellatus SS14]|nr:hypothetical protein M422DRAFT_24068 [Sphaerobolus stellatus SS14]
MKYTLPILLLATLTSTLAAPQPAASSSPITVPLLRKRSPARDSKWLQGEVARLRAKYGAADDSSNSNNTKRSSGFNELINQNTDSSYYGTLAVGTPPTSYDVILDTGSADFWLASSACAACRDVASFDPAASSTFHNLSTKFSIRYGSGDATGVLAQDTVQMAGFKVEGQTFALANSVSDGLLTAPVSGLLGLAFQSIAASGATPFWQTLVQNGAFDQPLFSFYLTRFIDDLKAGDAEPGGQFTLGATNTSLYTGEIDFINIPDASGTYWVIPITTLTVQGSELAFTSTTIARAAIDTGTTLVGGPPSAIAAIYAQIPGSFAGTGDYQSYWFYPCDTQVDVSISFGGKTWSIDPSDFMLSQVTQTQCVGAFFEVQMGSSAPSWIVGDTFLKNVYSVYRFNPPSVGFAELSSNVKTLYAEGNPLPSATIGSNPASVTGGSVVSGSKETNAAVSTTKNTGVVDALVGFVLSVVGAGLLL